ncbi:MAG: DUF2892 domain-containing protein [Solirubrobacterales bacterium]
MQRPIVNITPIERIGRSAIGLAATIAGTVLLASASGVLEVVLTAALALAGVDLLLTGAIGHCPLYRKLGFVPRSLKGSQ